MAGDLLGRGQVCFNVEALRSFYRTKRILVTGAAGSVGSELCMQLAQLSCAHLAVLDQSDHGLIEIVERVGRLAPTLGVTEALCDVRDAGRLAAWAERIEPDVVIHSAALKHVHMGERHPVECLLTNLVGTRNAVAAAAKAGAAHFMLISSDKAAAPACVMGATKRLAELHLSGFQLEHASPMRLKSVRFGNVLGSAGSVLPRFEAQLEAGGPLEITHKDMERYFMSAHEAVGLILSVLALGDDAEGGASSFYMDMGEPISIMSLAHALMENTGKHADIAITGLRPGEKLKEQMFDDYEVAQPTSLDHVFSVRPMRADAYMTSSDIAKLETIARTMNDAIVRQRIFAELDQRLGREELAAG